MKTMKCETEFDLPTSHLLMQPETMSLVRRIWQLERELKISEAVGVAHKDWAHNVTRRLNNLLASLEKDEREDRRTRTVLTETKRW
jgi:hypothetical protein